MANIIGRMQEVPSGKKVVKHSVNLPSFKKDYFGRTASYKSREIPGGANVSHGQGYDEMGGGKEGKMAG